MNALYKRQKEKNVVNEGGAREHNDKKSCGCGGEDRRRRGRKSKFQKDGQFTVRHVSNP
jgi:hypothetical protein